MAPVRYLTRLPLRAVAALAVLPVLVGLAVGDADADVSPAPPATLSPAGSAAPTPTVTPTPAPTAHTSAPVAASGPTLRSGSRGADVLRLQRRLRELGYDVGNSHGGFGGDTLHGVRAFQKVNGLKVDGVVTARVWARLADPVEPTPRYTVAGDAVEVDLTRRVLFLTRDGEVTAVFDVSPGKPSTPTVRGTFRIYRRVNRWDHGPLGGLYKPNYFHGGFALHGSLSVPTYAASHGCVRLTTASMDRLWTRLRKGERVSVYRT